ncbi:MAG: hypothetical protein IJI53_03185 [Clostridia bacterium]|nr:hypothetical protein [Clostridia bacterium]MBR0407021.1 hypothetical protein [Clostridia bacterium]
MLNAKRSVYIAAMEPLRFEALLGRAEDLNVLGGGSGEETARAVRALCPDFLLLDGVLAGVDSLAFLEQMSAEMPAPPRVLYLAREQAWVHMALQKGADAAARWNSDETGLLRLIEETARKPLPRLAEPWEKERDSIAEKYAAFLGIPQGYRGEQYICRAASVLACAPQLGASYAGLLYPYLASIFDTSPQAVEKAIRTAVEATWLRGSLNAIQSLFGYSVDAERGKPTNAEFLSMISGHVRRELSHRMEKKARETPKNWEKMPELA